MDEKITAWMVKDVVTVDKTRSVYEASAMMKKQAIGAVIIVDKGKPVGIFTERDLLFKVAAAGKDYKKTRIKDVMTSNVKTADISDTYQEVYTEMRSNNIRHMPVVKDGLLAGIVSIRDLLRFNIRKMEKSLADRTEELRFVKNMLDKTNDERNRKLFEQNKELQGLVMIDSLTGLYNHKYFREILSKEIDRAKRYKRSVTLLFIDIDFFKHYNDLNGHEQGNVVLKQIAEILKNESRNYDTAFKMTPIDIAARYGGEEFVIILPEALKKGGVEKAKRLLDDVRNYPFYNREGQPGGRLTISIGVAEYPADADVCEDLIRKADEALYQAKNEGRDKVV